MLSVKGVREGFVEETAFAEYFCKICLDLVSFFLFLCRVVVNLSGKGATGIVESALTY